jgi:hypothetical protein
MLPPKERINRMRELSRRLILLNPKNPRSPHIAPCVRIEHAAFLSKDCLIENKRATGRDKDNLDLIGLGEEPNKSKAPKSIKKKSR